MERWPVNWAGNSEPSKGSSNGVQALRAEEGEDLSPFSLVTCIDPGGVTGIATVWFFEEWMRDPARSLSQCLLAWEAESLQGTENYQTLLALRWIANRTHEVRHDLAIEDFVLRTGSPDRQVLSPVRITAKLEWQLWRGIKTVGGGKRTFIPSKQSPSDAKGAVNDARLRAMAMYTPGPDHARDATRHCVLWLRKWRAALLNNVAA